MINEEFWNELPDDLKQIIQEAIDQHVETQLAEMDRLNAEYTQKLEDNGVEILPITQEELDAYASKVREEVWPQLAEIVGQDVVDAVMADFN